jgi:septal ring factor EnvC (AmiA/AmiB activator)
MLGLLGILLPTLAAALSSVLVWQLGTANRKQVALEAKQTAQKVSKDEVREAFESAKRLYEGGLAEAQRQIENCNRRVAELEAREQALRRWIRQLEAALRDAGVPVPNGEPP